MTQSNVGPGSYDLSNGEAMTMHRSPNIDLGSSPARPNTFAKTGSGADVAPGQYDDGIRFNSNSKSFTIGEKRTEKTVETIGPGAYSPERADMMTKTRVTQVNIASSTSRP